MKQERRSRAVAEKVREPARSVLLDYYADAARIGGSGRGGSVRTIDAPRNFSLLDAPEEALGFFEKFVRAARSNPQIIDVRQDQCRQVELCAVAVLNALATEGRVCLGRGYRGTFPKGQHAGDIIAATGLPKQLDVKLPTISKIEYLGLIHSALEGGLSIDSSSTKERKARDVLSYLDKLLQRKGFELTRGGKRYFLRLMTEVLGNAEEHSGKKDWYITSYIHRPTEKGAWDCHLVIFNFGRSIAESLRELPADSTLRKGIEAMLDQHAGWFGDAWNEEALWTVYALQEGVSRRNSQVGNVLGDSGHGTVQLIEAFQNLGQSDDPSKKPRMCILSGRIHVSFDGTYRMEEKMLEGGPRKIVAFNTTNDLTLPPDGQAVRVLKHTFPGTLISLRFYLDDEYLSRARSPYGKSRN
jgi:hypothetical protein